MNVTDLMIGDWVCVPSELNRYKRICSTFDMDSAVLYRPIPLTAEILQSNGFMLDKRCDHAQKYVCPVEIKKIPQTILEFFFFGDGVSADTLFKCWTKPESCDGENSVHICDLKYVHQIQHALRLCNITKEIIIWK